MTNDDFLWLKTTAVQKFQGKFGPDPLSQDGSLEEVESDRETNSKSAECDELQSFESADDLEDEAAVAEDKDNENNSSDEKEQDET